MIRDFRLMLYCLPTPSVAAHLNTRVCTRYPLLALDAVDEHEGKT